MKKLSIKTIVTIAIIALIGIITGIIWGQGETYTIHVTVPAGTMDEFLYIEDFIYSDEEFSPQKKQLTLKSIDLPDGTEFVLKPIEVTEENAYERTYLDRGEPLLVDVEKGSWFKIGIALQNPTDEDIVVAITVENVRVRIK
jgi:hypothetical protein